MIGIDGDILLFFEKKPQALPLYEALEQAVSQRVPGAGRKVRKTQITFSNRRVFACASLLRVKKAKELPQPYLVATFGLSRRVESPRIAAAVEPYPGRWMHHVVIGAASEIDGELLGWIEEAAAFSAGKR